MIRNSGHSGDFFAALVLIGMVAQPGLAQTDYYNTDAGRPVLIEDAYPVERYGFELQLAPVRLERSRGGFYSWGLEPEIAWGFLPRTQLEVGFPLHIPDRPSGEGAGGLAGIELSILHNLNAETETLPALGLAVEALLPVGSLGPDRIYPSIKGIVTRTQRFARFHVNGRYTLGNDLEGISEHGGISREPTGELSRWMAGVAVDKTFPLRSALLIAAVYAHEPLTGGADVVWNAEAGVRYQLDPRFALDLGMGKRLSGDEQPVFLTFGAAYAFAIRALMPREVAR